MEGLKVYALNEKMQTCPEGEGAWMALGIYLHQFMSYVNHSMDLCCINDPLFLKEEGIYPCKTYLPNGEEYDTLLFFWRALGIGRGLVVFKEDKVGLEDAFLTFIEKPPVL